MDEAVGADKALLVQHQAHCHREGCKAFGDDSIVCCRVRPGSDCILFLSIALVHWIAMGIGAMWAYLIIGGLYLLLIGVFVLFKKRLIVNPICRFISQLLLS